MDILDLPLEVLAYIISFLARDETSFLSFGKTCRRGQDVVAFELTNTLRRRYGLRRNFRRPIFPYLRCVAARCCMCDGRCRSTDMARHLTLRKRLCYRCTPQLCREIADDVLYSYPGWRWPPLWHHGYGALTQENVTRVEQIPRNVVRALYVPVSGERSYESLEFTIFLWKLLCK